MQRFYKCLVFVNVVVLCVNVVVFSTFVCFANVVVLCAGGPPYLFHISRRHTHTCTPKLRDFVTTSEITSRNHYRSVYGNL